MITSIVDLVSAIKVRVYYAFGNILSRGKGGSICNFPHLLDKSVDAREFYFNAYLISRSNERLGKWPTPLPPNFIFCSFLPESPIQRTALRK